MSETHLQAPQASTPLDIAADPADTALTANELYQATLEEMLPLGLLDESSVSGADLSEPLSEAFAEQSSNVFSSLIAVLDSGGPVVTILLLMSVVALTLVLVKLAQFHRARLWQRKPAQQALALWQQNRVEEALKVADASCNPTAKALAKAVRGRRRQLPDAAIREEVLRYGSNALFQLRRGFRPLEVIGSLAPLLGLLGTVLGMISAFKQLEAAGNRVDP